LLAAPLSLQVFKLITFGDVLPGARLTRTYSDAKKKRSIDRILEAVGRGLNDTRLISNTIGLHTSKINQYLKEIAEKDCIVKVCRRSMGLARLNVLEINGQC